MSISPAPAGFGKLVFGGEAPRPISLRTLAIDAHRSPLDRNSSVNWYLSERHCRDGACSIRLRQQRQ